jgi:glycosyltransferase involved in cell wall biosynthesis
MHVVWVNEHASLVGGAEHYIKRTAELLRPRGVRSTLLYDPSLPTASAMLDAFEGAFPLVDLPAQVAGADLVFLHQVRRPRTIADLARCPAPVIKFLHDHWLFCLREHKYTLLGQQACSRTVSASACYPCIGFVRRAKEFPGLRLRTVAELFEEQRQHMRLDAFISGSSYMIEQAVAHGFDPARAHVVPLYAEPPKEATPETREAGRLLYVGEVSRRKGCDVMLRALARCDASLRLDVVGTGPWLDGARALARKLGLGARVAFLGWKAPEELPVHFQRAACLLVPSRTPEPFGMVGVEAMSHGTPVIGTRQGGLLEWLEPERTGIAVPPNDPGALAAAINWLLSDPSLAASMGAAARARYLERFQPEHHAARLLAIFDAVLRRGPRARRLPLLDEVGAFP